MIKPVILACFSLSSIFLAPLVAARLVKQTSGGTMWELEDEDSKMHAFESHGLSPYLNESSIKQSPVLMDIYNLEQLRGKRPKGKVGHPGNLHEAPEHHVDWVVWEVRRHEDFFFFKSSSIINGSRPNIYYGRPTIVQLQAKNCTNIILLIQNHPVRVVLSLSLFHRWKGRGSETLRHLPSCTQKILRDQDSTTPNHIRLTFS